jgi:hypothetical protein
VEILKDGKLELPDQPRPGAAVHRSPPGARLRDIAASPGITDRSAYGIVTDLAEAGYVAEQKDSAAEAAAVGRLTPVIGQRFALADAAVAHEATESRATTGRTVPKPQAQRRLRMLSAYPPELADLYPAPA